MDKEGEGPKPKRWDWLPVAMPGVAKLVREKRKTYGEAHVAQCWQKGMVDGEPGWFFAREGTIAIGTPQLDDPVMAGFCAQQIKAGQALVFMRTPEGQGNGAA